MTKKAKTIKEISVSTDKTITFQLIISSSQVKKEYKTVLAKVAKNIEIKGFRKGKAPFDVVEKQISLSKVYEDIVQNLLPKIYSDLLTKHKIKPIIKPQIVLKNPPLTLDKDWHFEAKTCQTPNITIRSYLTDLKKINKKKHQNPKNYNQEILKLLSSKTKITVPQILIDTQIKERMTQLIDSASQTGLTIEQYLEAKKTNIKDYQQNLQKNLIDEWKINLSLEKIANRNKIKISPEDIKKAIPDKNTSQQQTQFIYYILKQQKTIDHLKLIK